MYGISKDPDTKYYIMVIQYANESEERCEICGERYKNSLCVQYKWCKACQINNFKRKFTDWTSGNAKIDDFIQEMQLKINHPNDIVFEWIDYNQFKDIKEVGKGG